MTDQEVHVETLRASPEMAEYRHELARWLSGDTEEEQSLEVASAALCQLAHRLAIQPEQLLITLREGRAAPEVQEGTDRAARASQARAFRYTLAVNMLLKCYFD
jgi:hypothetical protein